jgi:hypothetical protein
LILQLTKFPHSKGEGDTGEAAASAFRF